MSDKKYIKCCPLCGQETPLGFNIPKEAFNIKSPPLVPAVEKLKKINNDLKEIIDKALLTNNKENK